MQTIPALPPCPSARRKTLSRLTCIAVGFLLSGCPGDNRPSLAIGAHRGALVLPRGWTLVDQGEKWEVRQGEASIVLHDLGPASPSAMQREAARIIELWRGGNAQGARTRVKRLLDNVVRFVLEPSRTPLVNTMLPLLETEAHRLPELELGQRFADWQRALGALPGVSLEALGDAALPITGHDGRRAIQSRERRTVGGKPAVDYLTVTRSTQQSRKRIVIIDNDGHLLAVYFGVLGHEAHLDAFDRLLRSLHFDAAASGRR